jgi:KDO2-lipid IV(A) lauroyltransferase
MWGRLRGLRRDGFRPTIEVDGLEHLRGALARGRGVVVWCMRVGSATVLKQGFSASGLPLTHLSRADHGSATNTRFGLGVVAPLHRRVEDAALRERVQIPIGESLAYLRTLGERLASNQCVSIFGEHTGRQSVTVTVLGSDHRFALGAPSLAWRENAGLVTAYALREGPFRYRVVIEEEMAVDRDLARRCFAERAVHEFAGRLERCILRHPADWHGWFYLVAPERGDSFAGRDS